MPINNNLSIRQKKCNNNVIFALAGKNANVSLLDDQLQEESKIFQDIVQFDFLDNYWNLSLKTILTFSWALQHYNTDIFVKIDDDVICNLTRIYHVMLHHINTVPQGQTLSKGQTPSQSQTQLQSQTSSKGQTPHQGHTKVKVIIGKCVTGSGAPNRNPKSPECVSKDVYPGISFPKACMGPTYVISREAAIAVLAQVRSTHCSYIQTYFQTSLQFYLSHLSPLINNFNIDLI